MLQSYHYAGTFHNFDINDPATYPPAGKEVLMVTSYGDGGIEKYSLWPGSFNLIHRTWDNCDCGEVVIGWTLYPEIPVELKRYPENYTIIVLESKPSESSPSESSPSESSPSESSSFESSPSESSSFEDGLAKT